MPKRDDVEESSSSSGYSPSDYLKPSEGLQEETTVVDLWAPQLASQRDEEIDTPAELDCPHSSDRAEGSLVGRERLLCWSSEDITSLIIESELERCLATRGVPREIVYRVPQRHERSCSPLEGYMAFSEALLRTGVRLPLHSFFFEVLEYAQIAHFQLHPNA